MTWQPGTLTVIEAADGSLTGVLSAGDCIVLEFRRARPGRGTSPCEVQISAAARIAYESQLCAWIGAEPVGRARA